MAYTLGEKLKKLRMEKAKKEGRYLSGNAAADEIGVSHSYYNRLENDKKKNPSDQLIKLIANYYDVSVGYLLNNKDDWKSLLPPELQTFVEENNIKYLEVAKKAADKEINPDSMDKIIEVLSKEK